MYANGFIEDNTNVYEGMSVNYIFNLVSVLSSTLLSSDLETEFKLITNDHITSLCAPMPFQSAIKNNY